MIVLCDKIEYDEEATTLAFRSWLQRECKAYEYWHYYFICLYKDKDNNMIVLDRVIITYHREPYRKHIFHVIERRK